MYLDCFFDVMALSFLFAIALFCFNLTGEKEKESDYDQIINLIESNGS